MLLLMLEDGEVADRFETSIKSFDAIKEHLKKYWITSPVDGVDLKLDIIGEESVTADNDVTDHYVESNEAYQDQITIKPTIYTINGEVGELVWYQKDTVSQRVGQVAQRLEGVVSFLPIRSRSFQQMKKKVMQAAQWVDTASNILDRFDTLTPGMTNQAQAFYWLMSWRNFRRPLTVVSPWGKLVNFVITNLRITQPRDTKDKSLISITFKEFRTTSVTTVDFEEDKFQGVAKQENQPKVDSGKTDGSDASPSKKGVDGNPVCKVELEDGKILDVRYDYKSKDIFILDPKEMKTLDPLSLDYEEATGKVYQQCEDSIADLELHGWGIDK